MPSAGAACVPPLLADALKGFVVQEALGAAARPLEPGLCPVAFACPAKGSMCQGGAEPLQPVPAPGRFPGGAAFSRQRGGGSRAGQGDAGARQDWHRSAGAAPGAAFGLGQGVSEPRRSSRSLPLQARARG